MFDFFFNGTKSDDARGIERLLRGDRFNMAGDFLRFDPAVWDNKMAAYSWGGYKLLTGFQNSVILDLDHSIYQNDETAHWRREAVKIADQLEARGEMKWPMVPVGATALWRGAGEFLAPNLRYLRGIHRQGMEGVFSVHKESEGKTYYFLSGYDTQENPPLYFLCRLPHAVATVNEAREALKPQSVKRAEKLGLEVKRQGDLFAIKTSKRLSDFSRDIQHYAPIANSENLRMNRTKGFYGTAHITHRAVQLPNGMWLGSGVMYHDPRLVGELRNPDHSPLELGEGAWMISRNTVPITGAARPGRTSRW